MGRDDAFDLLNEMAGFDVAGIRHPVAKRRRMTLRLHHEVGEARPGDFPDAEGALGARTATMRPVSDLKSRRGCS